MKPSNEIGVTDSPATLPVVACRAWLADKNLYLVTGKRGGHSTAKLYVIASDAGEAEQKANDTWTAWEYNHTAVETKIVASGKRYGWPDDVETIVC